LSPGDALARFDPPKEKLGRNDAYAVSQRYGFHVGGIDLLIHPDTVAELVEQATIFPIPNAPHWLRGLINLRGNLVPIYDLRVLLEVADENEQLAHRILILDRGDNMVGLLIDGLPQAIRGTGMPTNIPPLPSVLKRHVSEAYAGNGTIWLEFDHRGFFLGVAAGTANVDHPNSV
jgi:twitching motility protein PilI